MFSSTGHVERYTLCLHLSLSFTPFTSNERSEWLPPPLASNLRVAPLYSNLESIRIFYDFGIGKPNQQLRRFSTSIMARWPLSLSGVMA